jgi:hypothetical protein
MPFGTRTSCGGMRNGTMRQGRVEMKAPVSDFIF